MWHKVTWLFMWVTLALGSGCAGENQNHRMNQERTPLFREGYPTQPGGAMLEDVGIDPDGEPERSVTGVDRSGWDRLVIGPADGRVPHHPRYFTGEGYGIDWRLSKDRPTPLDWEGVTEHEADFATAGSREHIDGKDVADAALGIGKFAVDMVTFPYRVVVTPPWEIHYSPEWE